VLAAHAVVVSFTVYASAVRFVSHNANHWFVSDAPAVVPDVNAIEVIVTPSSSWIGTSVIRPDVGAPWFAKVAHCGIVDAIDWVIVEVSAVAMGA
jgi:hypothetical protein